MRSLDTYRSPHWDEDSAQVPLQSESSQSQRGSCEGLPQSSSRSMLVVSGSESNLDVTVEVGRESAVMLSIRKTQARHLLFGVLQIDTLAACRNA